MSDNFFEQEREGLMTPEQVREKYIAPAVRALFADEDALPIDEQMRRFAAAYAQMAQRAKRP